MHDPHGATAEHVGGPDHQREADPLGALQRLVPVVADVVLRLAQAEAAEQLLEALAVLREIDRIRRRAEDRHAGIGERLGELERGLAAELDDHAAQLAAARLDAHDLEHVLGGQRLEIEPIRSVVVGRDGLGVAVDHDGLEPGLGEAEDRVHAAVVELDPLTDPVRAAAQDDHLAPLARRRLAFGGGVIGQPGLVAAVEVRRPRLELRGAGIDPLEHGMDALREAPRRDRRRARAGKPGEPGVGEAHALELEQTMAIIGQAVAPHPLLGGDDPLDLLEKPRIVVAGGLDRSDLEPGAKGLRDHPDPLRRRARERRPDRLLRTVVVVQLRNRDLVQALEVDLERPQRFLQRFGEGAPDRHDLADRLHRRGQDRLRFRELLEREPRNLGHHVVDGRLERRRRAPGDVVGDLVEGVADRQARGDLGDGEAGGLGGQRRRARDPRVHLDDHHPAVDRVDGELDVGAAGVDADLAQDRDRGVAHALVFFVGKRERRRDRDAVPGVHAHRIDVLDRADDDAVVRPVAHHLHLVFFPAEDRLLDQDFADRRGVEAGRDHPLEFLPVVGDPAAGAAERVARPDDRREADLGQGIGGLGQAPHDHGARHLQADAAHRLAEQLAILGLGDRFARGADQLDAVALEGAVLGQGVGDVERGLAAHGRQTGVRALARDHLGQDLRRDRLDIGRVRQLRIGHDGRRVGVDQDDAVAFRLERLDRLGAGVIELAGLADHDRTGADHQDQLDIGTFGHQALSINARKRSNR